MKVKIQQSKIGVLVILLPEMKTMAIFHEYMSALIYCKENNLTIEEQND